MFNVNRWVSKTLREKPRDGSGLSILMGFIRLDKRGHRQWPVQDKVVSNFYSATVPSGRTTFNTVNERTGEISSCKIWNWTSSIATLRRFTSAAKRNSYSVLRLGGKCRGMGKNVYRENNNYISSFFITYKVGTHGVL